MPPVAASNYPFLGSNLTKVHKIYEVCGLPILNTKPDFECSHFLVINLTL